MTNPIDYFKKLISYNRTKEKTYKVLLVEDVFFRYKTDTPELIGGLEKEIAALTNHKIELEITPRVDKALENISTKKYDLIVTDIGLAYPYDDAHNPKGYWKEKLPEIYNKMISARTKNKSKLEAELGLAALGYEIDDFKKYENYEKISNKIGKNEAFLGENLCKHCYNSPVIESSFGIEVYNKSKKSNTVIFTNRDHCYEVFAKLYAHKIMSIKDVIDLTWKLEGHETMSHNNVYVGNKDDLANFAWVIDLAIRQRYE